MKTFVMVENENQDVHGENQDNHENWYYMRSVYMSVYVLKNQVVMVQYHAK